jgi:hypothetical protein
VPVKRDDLFVIGVVCLNDPVGAAPVLASQASALSCDRNAVGRHRARHRSSLFAAGRPQRGETLRPARAKLDHRTPRRRRASKRRSRPSSMEVSE